MKTYILLYNNSLGTEEEVKSLLDVIPDISDWRSDIENSFLLKSKLDAEKIADKLIEKKPQSRFFISEVSPNRQGWLPKEAWSFIKESD